MLPDEFPLQGAALRGWLNSAGQSILLEFESGKAALDFLRSNNVQIRTQDFYNIYSNVWDRYTRGQELQFIPENQLIPIADTITNHGWKLSDNFLYRFKTEGIDPETGDPITKFFAINSRRQLTVGEAAGVLGDLILGEEEFYSIAPTSFTLDAAYARPGLW